LLFGILKELAPCQDPPTDPLSKAQRAISRGNGAPTFGGQQEPGHRQFVAGRDSLMSVGLDCQRELQMTDGTWTNSPDFSHFPASMGSNCARGGFRFLKNTMSIGGRVTAFAIDFMAENARRCTKRKVGKNKPKASDSDGHSSGMCSKPYWDYDLPHRELK